MKNYNHLVYSWCRERIEIKAKKTMISDVNSAEERRLSIIRGVNQGLTNLEIANEMGVHVFTVIRDLKLMKQYRDPELVKAYLNKITRIEANKRSITSVRDEKFMLMTGMSFEEKSFENMINYYINELRNVIESKDESIAISRLTKDTQRILSNNAIISGGKNRRRISSKARAIAILSKRK